MFNPFAPFTSPLLMAFLSRGKTYFVRQTFNRAKDHFDVGIKGYFLFSQYDHLITAQNHYEAISYDPNRFLYDWSMPDHQERLKVAVSGLKEYKVYANVFRNDWERLVTPHMREKVRHYVKDLGWKPERNEGLLTHYEVQFGELFIRLNCGSREAKVKFEEIEKIY